MKEFSYPEQVLLRETTLDAIMQPLMENNPQAHLHSRMVAGSVMMMSELYSQNPNNGFTSETCDKAYVSALLHDLGKGNRAWVALLQGRPIQSNNDMVISADHTLLGSMRLKTFENKKILDDEFLEISRFIAKNHHTTAKYKQESHLANTKALFNDQAIINEYPRIKNWDELYDILMMIKIADALDSCTNNMPGKIPKPDTGYIRSIATAVPHIRLQFEGEAENLRKERFDKKFLGVFDLLAEQMIQYEQLMQGAYAPKTKAPDVSRAF